MDFDRRATGSRCGSIRFVIGWCAENAGGRVEDKSEKATEGPRRRVVQGEERMETGELPGRGKSGRAKFGKVCRLERVRCAGGTSFQLSVLSFE